MFVPDSIANVAAELYALPPGRFRAARDERAAQAKAAGERDLAAQIRKLARPTVSAWLANQLARRKIWDQTPLLQALERGDIAEVMLDAPLP